MLSRPAPGDKVETVPVMDLSHVARTGLAIQIVLHDLAGRFIVASDALAQLSNERVEGQRFRITVDSVHQVNGGDYIDLAIQGG